METYINSTGNEELDKHPHQSGYLSSRDASECKKTHNKWRRNVAHKNV